AQSRYYCSHRACPATLTTTAASTPRTIRCGEIRRAKPDKTWPPTLRVRAARRTAPSITSTTKSGLTILAPHQPAAAGCRHLPLPSHRRSPRWRSVASLSRLVASSGDGELKKRGDRIRKSGAREELTPRTLDQSSWQRSVSVHASQASASPFAWARQ